MPARLAARLLAGLSFCRSVLRLDKPWLASAQAEAATRPAGGREEAGQWRPGRAGSDRTGSARPRSGAAIA